MLITNHEIRKLPKWARVAFASRCIRRVVGLYRHAYPDAPTKHIQALERVVNAVEDSARRGQLVVDRAAVAAVRAAIAVAPAPAADIATAVNAAIAVRANAAAAATTTVRAAEHAATHYVEKDAVEAAHESDFHLLLQLATEGKWSNKTPVTPEVCGPIWPLGAPVNWPVPTNASTPEELAPTNRSGDRKYDNSLILQALDNLKSHPSAIVQRGVVFLHEQLNGANVNEIGEHHSVSVGYVKSCMRYAREKIRNVIDTPDSSTIDRDGASKAPRDEGFLQSVSSGNSRARLDVTLDIPPDVDDESAQVAVRELYDALNELHVASGGSGLVVEDYQSFVEQFAEVLA